VNVCTLSSDEDNPHIQALLAKFDEVHRRHQEHRKSDHVLAQASGTSVVGQSNPPFRGSVPGNDRSGYIPTSTAFIGDPLNISPAQRIDDRGTLCDGIPFRLVPADTRLNLPGAALSPPNNSRVGFANVYPTLYSLIPGQIVSRGGISRPPFLPTPFPRSGSTDIPSQRIQSSRPPSPHMRYVGQRRHSSVYDHRRGYTPPIWVNRLATSRPSLPPHRLLLSFTFRSEPTV
jgi:hypothetical protein